MLECDVDRVGSLHGIWLFDSLGLDDIKICHQATLIRIIIILQLLLLLLYKLAETRAELLLLLW